MQSDIGVKLNKKMVGIALSTAIMLVAIILIGPLDLFTHGFFCDEIDFSQMIDGDPVNYIRLDSDHEVLFSPQKAHLTGFEIVLTDQSDDDQGELILQITDENGKKLDEMTYDLSQIPEGEWYICYTEAKLKPNAAYTLKISARNYDRAPCLMSVDQSYLPEETVAGDEGGVVLCYGYAESTFTFHNKILISLLIAAIWLLVIASVPDIKNQKQIRLISGSILLVLLMEWNYMYNFMDDENEGLMVGFSFFQDDSETLVTGAIVAEERGCYNLNGYGLGRYNDLKGTLDQYLLIWRNDKEWRDGYSKNQAAIIVNANDYSYRSIVPGNYIRFQNEETFQIINVEWNDNDEIICYLDSDHILTPAKYGSLDDVSVLDGNFIPFPAGQLYVYESQYGLQGKIFRHLARYMEDEQEIANLNLLCCAMTGIVLVAITLLIAVKYNKVLAGCFYVTFWLSPWVVNFARNLYWVEFTWFIPMATGLFCAWKIESRRCRALSYVAAFIAITGKCLCGYEYISSIMMGLIAFLLTDLVLAMIKRDRQKSLLLIRTIVITGVIALAGFMAAICIHARLRGDGNILEGINSIIEQDVLRRTMGGDLNQFDKGLWESFNASVWETVCQYFHFKTEIILGIPGNLFPLLCIVPIFIFWYESGKKKLNAELLSMYIIFFLAAVSWFGMAKSHSYGHTHMNYVLWYFGFVQICFYIILNQVLEFYGHIRTHKTGEDRS